MQQWLALLTLVISGARSRRGLFHRMWYSTTFWNLDWVCAAIFHSNLMGPTLFVTWDVCAARVKGRILISHSVFPQVSDEQMTIWRASYQSLYWNECYTTPAWPGKIIVISRDSSNDALNDKYHNLTPICKTCPQHFVEPARVDNINVATPITSRNVPSRAGGVMAIII